MANRDLGSVLAKPSFRPNRQNTSPLESSRELGPVSQDGKTMQIFCHYESYPSGSEAKPVVETIFDTDHPNRIGLLPHQAAGSKPIKAVQIVTTMDARYRRRRIDLIVDGGEVETVPLPEQKKSVQKSDRESETDQKTDDPKEDAWQTIPVTQIPIDQSTQMRKLKFSMDAEDLFNRKLLKKFDSEWAYVGVRNCQTWWLPLDQDFKVEILQTAKLPSLKDPSKMIPIPGGPVIKSVRITIPMPATEPIWMEISPDESTVER